MRAKAGIRRALALLMSLMMLLTLAPVSAFAADQTVTLSFGAVQWTDSDEDLQEYSDLAGQKVLVVPIVATSSDGQPFNMGGCEFQVNFNRNNKALVYKNIADEGCGVLGFVGKGKNFLSVSASDPTTANNDGYVKALFSDMNGRSFTVENNQVIAKIIFWPDESGKNLTPDLSFNEGARVSDVDADKNPVPYTVTASGSANVDPYETKGDDTPPTAQTITLSFGTVQWTDSDEDLQDYSDLAGQKVLVAPIVASSSDGQPFSVGGCEFQVNFNRNNKTLVYKVVADEGSGVLGFVGKGKNFLSVSASDPTTANNDGYVKALFSDMNGRSFEVENNQVIAKIIFWPDDAGKDMETQLSFNEGARVSDVDADKNPVPYTVATSGAVTVDPYNGKGPVTYTVTIADGIEHGSVSVNPTSAAANDTVTVTVTPDTGYELETLTVDGETTKNIAVTGNKFTMPAENVTVTATFKEIQTAPTEYDIAYATAQHGSVDGVKKSEAAKEITLTVTPDEGYELEALTVDGEKTKNITVTDNKFTMPAENVTVTATFKEISTPAPTEYDITYATAEHGSVDGVKKSEAAKEITLTVTPDDGYELDALTVDGEKTKNITVTDNKFTMPAENVTVTATFKEISTPAPTGEITVSYTAQPSRGGSVTGPETVKPGDTVTFEVSANGDYVFQTLTVNGATVTVTDGKATFTVPADATKVEVKATFRANNPNPAEPSNSQGCYIATSVYGSYDTPEVWTLRRFRDDVLGQTWYGRLFIKAYYATSPTLVRWFGDAEWFRNFWRDRLDSLVSDLQEDGFESTPYQDKDW